MTKELQNVIDAIHIWADKNRGNSCFFAEFISFGKDDRDPNHPSVRVQNKKGTINDDFTCAYGPKKIIKIMLEDSLEAVQKEKSDFINW